MQETDRRRLLRSAIALVLGVALNFGVICLLPVTYLNFATGQVSSFSGDVRLGGYEFYSHVALVPLAVAACGILSASVWFTLVAAGLLEAAVASVMHVRSYTWPAAGSERDFHLTLICLLPVVILSALLGKAMRKAQTQDADPGPGETQHSGRAQRFLPASVVIAVLLPLASVVGFGDAEQWRMGGFVTITGELSEDIIHRLFIETSSGDRYEVLRVTPAVQSALSGMKAGGQVRAVGQRTRVAHPGVMIGAAQYTYRMSEKQVFGATTKYEMDVMGVIPLNGRQ